MEYVREIKPLLKGRCYACHGVLKQKGGLRLDTGAAIHRGGKHGLIILTNDVASSPLLLRVTSTNSEERMPAEGEALAPEQIARLRNWIAQGAPSPTGEKPEPDPREHWAFKPPMRPPLPRILNPPAPIRNPVDAFIFAEHEKRGLRPSPEARKEFLLRRVYLDLIGLPPEREELHAFLVDTSPEAYENVVNRLLASPQYAQRWARHWMDIWRYADWYGRRHVPDVWNSAPQVWRWRDWIVRSLNSDKGYDRMIIETLAADEVAPEDDEARPATGLLVRNWYALNPNQWMRDTVEHTGKAFLGLTFNCAHCHDHKYDPISQRDYFRFRAFFEPLQARQDWVQGESDPGPFQKYEYGATRKVITNGMVSVFDENLDAKTFIYLRGDERSFPDGKPTVEPGMPAFLQGDSIKTERLELPEVARYPGLKPFIREAETKQREQTLIAANDSRAAAEKALTEARARVLAAEATNTLVARAKAVADLFAAEVTLRNRSNQLAVAKAELDAIRARIAADEATYFSSRGSGGEEAHSGESESQKRKTKIEHSRLTAAAANDLAVAAARAERLAVLRKAEEKLADAEAALALLQAEQSITAARRSAEGASEKKEDKDTAQVALKKAQEWVATAQRSMDAAQAALSTNSAAYTPLTPLYPAQSTGRRRALANWIASRDNPLTARVAVNHIWARHFHTPLVASVFDFGRNGASPTHPELLDWLAVEFMEHGWSMKHLHRLIVTSSAYRQASGVGVERGGAASERINASTDSGNRYLWRMNSGQMEAEVLRDSILHLAGELDLTPVGYPLPNADAEKSHRRSLYFECFPEPNGQSQFAEIFDAPNPTECYRRTQTIVPQQALALTNSKLSNERSHALAQRLAEKLAHANDSDGTDFITAAYEQVLTRRPTDEELAACRDFLVKQSKAAKGGDSARASLIRVLLNHNDFVTVR
ncbi:MAG: colicin uptake protein [Verrucomicrobia bacterium]|nr:MAG: colicin uptake protein [Verrucomicrobiota bacterium]